VANLGYFMLRNFVTYLLLRLYGPFKFNLCLHSQNMSYPFYSSTFDFSHSIIWTFQFPVTSYSPYTIYMYMAIYPLWNFPFTGYESCCFTIEKDSRLNNYFIYIRFDFPECISCSEDASKCIETSVAYINFPLFHSLYRSVNVLGIVKSKRLQWTGHITRIRKTRDKLQLSKSSSKPTQKYQNSYSHCHDD
jgi:hypothetical protein